ncbi:hypothetical protein CLOM_g21396 [Closterium sp. NIES-68]|nr:hypothetical protein CLOM_g21396 [Closterium sp. NIES-68]
MVSRQAAPGSDDPWMKAVVPGMVVEGTVLVKQESAMGGRRHAGDVWMVAIVSPDALKGVKATVPADLATRLLTIGERIAARVVDVGEAARTVVLTVGDIPAPQFSLHSADGCGGGAKSGSDGKGKRTAESAAVLRKGTRLLVRVQLTTPHYAVVSLPASFTLPTTTGQSQAATSAPLLATLAGGDFNLPHVDVPRVYRPGQTVAAAVVALPTAQTGGRIVLARDELVSFSSPSATPAAAAATNTEAAPAPAATGSAADTQTPAATPPSAAAAAATPAGAASAPWHRRFSQLNLLVGAEVEGQVQAVFPSAALALVSLGGWVSAILRTSQFPSPLHSGDAIKARVERVLLGAAAATAIHGKAQGQKQGKEEKLGQEEQRVVDESGMCVLLKGAVLVDGGGEKRGEEGQGKKGQKGKGLAKGEGKEVKRGGLEGKGVGRVGVGEVIVVLSDDEEQEEEDIREEDEEGEEETGDEEEEDEEKEYEEEDEEEEEEEEMEVDEEEEDDSDEGKEGEEGDEEEGEEEEEVAPLPVAINGSRLAGARRLPAEESDEEERVEEESEEVKKQRKKRAKKREKEARERAIQEAEQRRVRGQQAPETEAEFEQLLLASPNSSFLWIKFMAFLLSLSEIDKARAVAERALKSISYREEGEKLNIWVAYLNLENMHGNPPKEAVLTLFQRALAYTDPKKLHIALLGVFERSQQHDMADTLLHSMAKKFSTSAKVWLRYIQNQLSRGLEEGARKMMERALTVLPQRKHIKVISQAALMEYRMGSQERGRTLFESILRNFPKRTDLWITYIDQEVRVGDMAAVRRLFERVVSLDLPPKKMKSLLKKYLDFETAHGTQEQVAHVKARAVEYVQRRMGAGGNA